jgi:hypothetical protein
LGKKGRERGAAAMACTPSDLLTKYKPGFSKKIHPSPLENFYYFNFTFFRFYKNMIKEKIIKTTLELL